MPKIEEIFCNLLLLIFCSPTLCSFPIFYFDKGEAVLPNHGTKCAFGFILLCNLSKIYLATDSHSNILL